MSAEKPKAVKPAATAAPANPQMGEHAKPSLATRLAGGGFGLSLGALIAALFLGGLLIAATDPATQKAAGYFFARPTDTLSAAWKAAAGAYKAMFEGAIFNPKGKTFADQIRPLTETLTVATPLILAGLAVALPFRAGLFNIGAQGQIILGALVSGYVGFAYNLPLALHLVLVIIGGIIGGAIWGGLVGLLKAKTGAHEVILSIMLNYIAANLILLLLKTPTFQREGSSNPISPILPDSALLPRIFPGSDLNFRLHWGFVLAIIAVIFASWLIERSTIGFRLRAVGANPNAARTAGINVANGYIIVMAIAGALAGLAGVAQVAGTEKTLTTGIAASFGFDAITVALLGRAKPWGTFFAALLYGAFRAGGVMMQATTGTNIDIVAVVQALIVLFIAAPPLVRTIFRLPDPANPRKKKASKNNSLQGAQ
ncbi:ABC transporter permease [Rothia terrae]|uniref:ABC transporter permease n=1 Tax=Rothia terrae TaxID=396015 RepID=UPI00144780CC|nr:ABC transporter permease [Rothia terrae]